MDGEVDRFRSVKMDELELYFREECYIGPVEILHPEEIRIRVMPTLKPSTLDRDKAQEAMDQLISRLASDSSIEEGAQ